ncbi:hypothetical protein IMZ11_04395 [Microtetraspora sp. AC03309]|uniref:hypothetical protein n=1 Tax=Microtetraspora sp. AC03309 TaxID=2779376 RepID=UPI001E50EA08|nr:hypothetical protein [Microtetraspora sp. AC03309]MCC5574876.1 hypothetical protein [Microtetraspora sp. AC03309]
MEGLVTEGGEDAAVRGAVDLGAAKIAPKAVVTMLTGGLSDVNALARAQISEPFRSA